MGSSQLPPAAAHSARNRLGWIPLSLAATAILLALLIGTNRWAMWFAHPIRQPMPQTTIDGAKLLRVMLVVAAAAILVVPVLLRRWCVPMEPAIASSERKRPSWALPALIALALFIRATRLTEGLWYDEIAAYLSYGNGLDSPLPILGNYFDPVNHVLHTFLSWCSIRSLSAPLGTELAFRVPALVFSLLGVAAMLSLGRAVGGTRLGILAGFVAAAMPVAVLEGAEARGYSMMMCFATLMTWSLLEARGQNRAGLWIVYAVCCTLGIWSHFVTAVVPIGHAVWMTWRAIRDRQWKPWLAGMTALAFGAVLTITALSPLLPDFLHQRGVFFAARGDEPTIFGAEGRHAIMQLGGSWYIWSALPGLVLLALGAASIRRAERLGDAVACAMLGLPLMMLGVTLGGSWIYARFTLFALPGAMLLIAAGLNRLWIWKPTLSIAALLILLAGWMTDLAVRPPKQPLRDAADLVRSRRSDSDAMLEIGLAHEVMRLYAGDMNLTYMLQHGKDLPKFIEKGDLPRWIVIEFPSYVQPENYMLLEEQGYRTVQGGRFKGWADWTEGDVVVMEKQY